MTHQEMEPYIGKEVVIEYSSPTLKCEVKGKLIHVYLVDDRAFFIIKIVRRTIFYKHPVRRMKPLRGECILMCKGVEKMTLANQKPKDLYGDFIGGST